MERLFIGESLAASFTHGGAGLNVPFVHVSTKVTREMTHRQAATQGKEPG
jgi:hypothetical protein